MEELKKRFIEEMTASGDELAYVSWAEIERTFGIPPSSRPGDRARKWWKSHLKKLNSAPEIVKEVSEEEVSSENDSLRLRRTWQVQSKGGEVKWLASYENTSTEDVQNFRDKLIEDINSVTPFKGILPLFGLKERYPKNEGRLIEISIPDYHIGRHDLEKSAKEFNEVLEELILEACDSTGNFKFDRILFPIGNDWLNTDTLDYTTTRGTKQFDIAPWYDTFRYGWQTLFEGIRFLQSFAPVDVIVVPGNHDRARMFYIGDVLAGLFNGSENVTIDNSQDPFKFYRYGNNLIMFEHGELKPHVYPLIMADERKKDWAETEFREVHVGHFHKEMLIDEFRGVKVRFLPSLSKESDWEKQSGYRHQKQAQALLWDKQKGLRQTIVINR